MDKLTKEIADSLHAMLGSSPPTTSDIEIALARQFEMATGYAEGSVSCRFNADGEAIFDYVGEDYV